MSIKFLLASILFIAISFSAAKAQAPTTTGDSLSTIVGKWAGSFEGASSGKFELVLNQGSDRKLGGQVIMLLDDGSRYPIDLKTIVWQKGQLTATYVNPQGSDEVSFTGNLASSALKGTWKSDAGQAAGTWQATR